MVVTVRTDGCPAAIIGFAFLGHIPWATVRHALVANVATADGLHYRGWYGLIAVQQLSLGGNYLRFQAGSGWATRLYGSCPLPSGIVVLTILTLAFRPSPTVVRNYIFENSHAEAHPSPSVQTTNWNT